MDPIIRNFLDFFQDYINICQSPCWPSNGTTHEEILNAFKIGKHIKECLERLDEKSLTKHFMSAVTVQNKQCTSSLLLKECFSDPPKYILKKIIISSCEVIIMDYAFQSFCDQFSERELEIKISELMLEAASKDTLLKNLSTEINKDDLLNFKSNFLLSELMYGVNSKSIVVDMLTNDCTQDIVDLLVLCTLNREIKYNRAVDTIVEGLSSVMSSTSFEMRTFWKCLLKTEETTLIRFCLDNFNLYNFIIKALIECCLIINSNMSMERFYIEMSYLELKAIVRILCKNETLNLAFCNDISFPNIDKEFWNNLLS